jgi:hypothetical protein
MSARFLTAPHSSYSQNTKAETRDLEVLVSVGVSLHESRTESEEAKPNGQARAICQ